MPRSYEDVDFGVRPARRTSVVSQPSLPVAVPASVVNPYDFSSLNTNYYSSPEFLNAINTTVAPQPSATNPYGLSPEAAAELAAFDLPAYQAEFLRRNGIVSSRDAAALAAAQATGVSNIDMYANPIGAGEIIPGSTASIMAGLGMYDPTYQAVMRTYGSTNDRDNPNDVSERSTFAVDPTGSYRLVDNKTGAVIASASNPAEIRSLVDTANSMSKDQGSKANWSIEQAGLYSPDPNKPLEQSWTSVASDKLDNDMGPMGSVLDVALPLLASAIIPGAGFLGTILPAAGGAAASSALQGRGLEETLIRSALAGGMAGIGEKFITPALSSVLKPVSNVASNAASNVASNVAAQAAADAAGQGIGDIVVTAIPKVVSGLGSGLSSALSSGLSNAITSSYPSYTPPATQSPLLQQQTPAETSGLDALSDITVTAQKPLPPVSPFAVDPVVQNLINDYAAPPSMQPVEQPVQQQEPDTAQDDIVVTAQKPLPTVSPFAVDPVVQNLINDYAVKPTTEPQEPKTFDDEIVVTAQKPLPPVVPPLSVPLNTLNPLPADVTNAAETPAKDKGLTTEQKIRLAALALSTLGGLGGGGGGSGGSGTIPGGLGRLTSPLFTQQLSPLTPEQNRAKYGARNMTGTDWATWGSRPATSFFYNVQQQPTGMAHGGSFAAKRGGSKPRTQFAVNGPGTGRSDDIPAVLSDGEYVIDAETVALLGDGSSKAGAKKLDDLRVKVRKHKGKKLAQGRFSANAKSPEAYLSGGRT
jgi:hypothetical protein